MKIRVKTHRYDHGRRRTQKRPTGAALQVIDVKAAVSFVCESSQLLVGENATALRSVRGGLLLAHWSPPVGGSSSRYWAPQRFACQIRRMSSAISPPITSRRFAAGSGPIYNRLGGSLSGSISPTYNAMSIACEMSSRL